MGGVSIVFQASFDFRWLLCLDHLGWKKLDLKLAEKVVDMGLGIAPSLLFGQDINGIRINYSRLDEANISLFYSKMKILEQWLTE